MYKAVGNKVIVKMPGEAPQQETLASGLVVVNAPTNKFDPTTIRAEIISVGEGKINPKNGDLIPPTVKVGDVIVINSATGHPLDDDAFRVVNVDDIFAVIG